MFDTLLESRPHAERFTGGAIASVAAHAAAIALAVIATAQAHLESPVPREIIRVDFFAPKRTTSASPTAQVRPQAPAGVSVPTIDIGRMSPGLPAIDVLKAPSAPIDFAPKPIGSMLTPGAGAGEGSESNEPFQADQVERQVSFVAGSGAPRYPDALRSSGVEGKVVAQFVVDESGRAEADSVRFLSSDNQRFEAAVRAALPRMRFTPAEIGGRKVRQLVQMPFVFTIDR